MKYLFKPLLILIYKLLMIISFTLCSVVITIYEIPYFIISSLWHFKRCRLGTYMDSNSYITYKSVYHWLWHPIFERDSFIASEDRC